MSLSPIGAVHDLRIIFHGIDRVSHVADSIQSKVRALGGAIAILGGSGLFVTNLAEQFGILSKKQAESLDKIFSLIAATGTLISVIARLAPAIMAAASAQNIMNAATAVADALSGPLGWALLAGAIAALAAWGLSSYIAQNPQGTSTSGSQTSPTQQMGVTTSNVGPGPIGGTALQGGGSFITSGPTRLLVGEAGPEEVNVIPLGRGRSGLMLTANITINGTSDPQATARAVKRELEILIDRERNRRT